MRSWLQVYTEVELILLADSASKKSDWTTRYESQQNMHDYLRELTCVERAL